MIFPHKLVEIGFGEARNSVGSGHRTATTLPKRKIEGEIAKCFVNGLTKSVFTLADRTRTIQTKHVQPVLIEI